MQQCNTIILFQEYFNINEVTISLLFDYSKLVCDFSFLTVFIYVGYLSIWELTVFFWFFHVT